MTRETDPAIVKRIERIERTLEQHGIRIEDLERATSPDGVVYHEQSQIADTVARVCQKIRQDHGDTQTDFIGA